MYCERCSKKMSKILSFSKKRNYEYYKCPICGYETRKVPVFINQKVKHNKYGKEV